MSMTAAEFRIARESLGLGAPELAFRLGVALRTVRRWEHGHSPVPGGVAEDMRGLLEDAEAVADLHAAAMTRAGQTVYHIRGAGDPGWNRAIARRVMERLPGVRVVYDGETAPTDPR